VESKEGFDKIEAYTLRQPTIHDDGKSFSLDVVSEQGDATLHPCSKELYIEVEKDKIFSNYRVVFTLHKNKKTGLVEYISTRPKTEYQAYQVEYAESIGLPNKKLYKEPLE